MAAIEIQGVSKRFERQAQAGREELRTLALDEVSCEFRDGEVVTVVGPSGCGKSTLLRIIAGLETPTSGEVLMDGKSVTSLPARERNVAMVFQSYALYPHMTCYENLALNLELRKVNRAEIDARVHKMARTLEIEELLQKRPGELSGGQRQRVAVGRALIRDPHAFLLDEPLSNLDAALRERVRHELKELFRTLSATVIYVTHDQIEAMTLADRVVILNAGRIQQTGTPEQVYSQPANQFVASFIGSPSMNFLDAELRGGEFSFGGGTIATGTSIAGPVTVGLRPEDLEIAPPESGPVKASVRWVEHLGAQYLVGLNVEAETGELLLTATTRQQPEGDVSIRIAPEKIHLFAATHKNHGGTNEKQDEESGENLRIRRSSAPAGV